MQRLRWGAKRAGIAAILCALLIAALFACSTQWKITRRGARSILEVRHGFVYLTWNHRRDQWDWPWSGWSVSPAGGDWKWSRAMSHPTRGINTIGGWKYVRVPLGPPVFFLACGGGMLLLLTRTAVPGRGYCVRCGYDLDGLPPETKQCPECGGSLRGGDDIHVNARYPKPGRR